LGALGAGLPSRLLKKQLKIDLVLVGRAVAWDVYLTGAPAGEAAERAGG
jgi:hypothetical protein